jgi:hypothetical protein
VTWGWSTHERACTQTLLLLVVLLLLLLLRLLLLLERNAARPWVVEPSVLLLVRLLLQLLVLWRLRAAHLMLTHLHVAAAVLRHKPGALGSPALVPDQTAIWASQETSVARGADRHHVGQVAL